MPTYLKFSVFTGLEATVCYVIRKKSMFLGDSQTRSTFYRPKLNIIPQNYQTQKELSSTVFIL
jgi:hypothetical protein